ncbi:MAG: SPOR domain-containing protein [Bradyrhizobium sp.]|uniref:SPOR domain-containing protein n=1 Tax=Bradyrhizobium sp. TaxID=376 RepID=UPI0025C114ED|nr:SPOR domain-containing protein [Bradyrhizobium sp.]MBI5263185.1 SPOR domain-containing protein [Bradyrhizobium sp.]
MADRYQDRPFPADDYSHGDDQHGSARAESDPLAELARLIGQTDPFGTPSRASVKVPPHSAPEPYQPPVESYEEPEAQLPSPPAWMRRANVQAQPQPSAPPQQVEFSAGHPVHPLHRHAQPATPEQDYQQHASYPEGEDTEQQHDPSRYDDALYGQLETGEQQYQSEPAYEDDPYAYQSDYPEDVDEEEAPKRRGGMLAVAAVLALAVVGTGAAFAYRTYIGSPRSGEPPIIKADNSPTKIMPAPSDGSGKLLDRVASADGTEKIVPREEAPVDINARSGGPRVVFPPLNQNANPPPVASVAPSNMPPPSAGPVPSNGTLSNNEPRRIRTLSVKGDQMDAAAAPAPTSAGTRPAATPKTTTAAPARNPPSQANASANAPMSLAPQASPPEPAPTRVATANPTQVATSANPASEGTGGYMVSISSQPTEAGARDSYRVLQGKFQSVLGSRSPVIRRVDLNDRVVYRAMVGPYRTRQEAAQFCTELKAAGGQCFIP